MYMEDQKGGGSQTAGHWMPSTSAKMSYPEEEIAAIDRAGQLEEARALEALHRRNHEAKRQADLNAVEAARAARMAEERELRRIEELFCIK